MLQTDWNTLLLVKVTFDFRQWLGAKQVINHYLNQSPTSVAHICVPWHWIKEDIIASRNGQSSTDVAVSVCGRFGLWPFRFVAVPVCGRFGLWPFRFVAVSVCGRFGCGRFGLWPLWPVTSPGSQHACKPHFPRTSGHWAAQSLD